MIPRQRLDIDWSDLAAGVWYCLSGARAKGDQAWIEAEWSMNRHSMVSLSVRSGFDALLSVLDFPPGSEVLVSALTIRDMVRILEDHQLVAVPVDVDIQSLAVNAATVMQAITPRTRAILIAHLFGSRMPMAGIVQLAQQHCLFLIEDCAQAYCADDFRGDAGSDVSCFSFGPIKTATALAGGVLSFRDAALCRKVRQWQAGWPVQSQWRFFHRVCKYGLLKLVSARWAFTLSVGLCRALGIDYDQWLGRLVRGFAGSDFFSRIRHRPSPSLISLLARRLRQRTLWNVEQRKSRARTALALLLPQLRVGQQATFHSHWVFPIVAPRPDELMLSLWNAGVDATRGASSMIAVSPPSPGQSPATESVQLLESVLYLPVGNCRSDVEVERLIAIVNQSQQTQSDFAAGRIGK